MKSLWEQLEEYSESDYYPFHMPGHKRFPEENALALHKRLPEEGVLAFHKRIPEENAPDLQECLRKIYQCDITEIEGFDNLHDARGLLLALQQKTAHVYHAEQSFFLVNGSTGGILSAVSAVAQEKKKLLLARNCHKSVYHAVLLNRLQAEYVWPEFIEEFDIQGEVTAEEIEKHLCGRQDICGVVITSPTYDGIVSDVRKIAETVHDHHIPLIVDEAHGAHFALSEKAPESAAECGADLVINSVHKTLPALTQTALLHVQGQFVDRERLKSFLSVYQTSSPSYLLMASIDGCVDFIENQGRESYERLIRLRGEIDRNAKTLSRIRILPKGGRRDPGKLVISVKDTGMTGLELYRILLQEYHLQMEMWAPSYVLGILTCMDAEEGVERLNRALREIDGKLLLREKERKDGNFTVGNVTEGTWAIQCRAKISGAESTKEDIRGIRPQASGLSIFEAMQSKKKRICVKSAAGKISGGFVYFYPPGIPLLVPGEAISEELASWIAKCGEKQEYLTGISEDGTLCVLSENTEE